MKKWMLSLALVFLAGSVFAEDGKGDGKKGPGDKGGKRPDPEKVFKSLDGDGDGKLSREEFSKAPMLEKIEEKKPGSADKFFSRLDANKDGSLSLEEFKKMGEGRKKPGKGEDK